MPRPLSKVAPQWWDFTTLEPEILDDAARLTAQEMKKLSRPGFRVLFYDTLEEFYLAEALEYVAAWRQSTEDNPVGICGPIGPTEQLPLVARLVNDLDLDIRSGHFWGMDEWVDAEGVPVPITHPLSFARADMELCFRRIRPKLRMPDDHLHFPTGDLKAYAKTYDAVRCTVMQGGQGEVKHWAFNDPPQRIGRFKDQPPSPEEYRKLSTRVTELHPMTIIQNCADLRRRPGVAGASESRHRWTAGNLEGGESLDLARRQARQPLWPAADDADDRQTVRRLLRAHVVIGRPSQRAVQFLPPRDRHGGCGNALRIGELFTVVVSG